MDSGIALPTGLQTCPRQRSEEISCLLPSSERLIGRIKAARPEAQDAVLRRREAKIASVLLLTAWKEKHGNSYL